MFLLNYTKVSSAPSIQRFITKATADGSSLEPPDVARLAETARISLTLVQRGKGLCKARANDTFKFKKTTKACQYSSVT
ncbi:hypothetical protein SADUNF_Sadunf05G0113400 [Salix dunnii]|uniref:Uncharacterized protein n=1 Tax=Salix dunnii TaxID=1413687 RepID=A0A835KAT2_9ROSI|nr:hypothetical protein SADUNF_Sadunf05G0113400 [Salix dunnii]